MTVKEVVSNAGQFVEELYPDARDVRLEEVSLTGALPRWEVVVSFRLPIQNPLSAVIGDNGRLFKLVELDQETGDPQALKVWKP